MLRQDSSVFFSVSFLSIFSSLAVSRGFRSFGAIQMAYIFNLTANCDGATLS